MIQQIRKTLRLACGYNWSHLPGTCDGAHHKEETRALGASLPTRYRLQGRGTRAALTRGESAVRSCLHLVRDAQRLVAQFWLFVDRADLDKADTARDLGPSPEYSGGGCMLRLLLSRRSSQQARYWPSLFTLQIRRNFGYGGPLWPEGDTRNGRTAR